MVESSCLICNASISVKYCPASRTKTRLLSWMICASETIQDDTKDCNDFDTTQHKKQVLEREVLLMELNAPYADLSSQRHFRNSMSQFALKQS